MKKLFLATSLGLFAVGMFADVATVHATPPRATTCTGSSSVWDDTDIVHLTKQGAGTLVLSWRAQGRTTLDCGSGSPLTGKVAHIEQRVDARIGRGGAIEGKAQTRVNIDGKNLVFQGRYTGTTTVNAGVLSVTGVVDGGDRPQRHVGIQEHGTINLAAKQWTGLHIDDFIIGVK